MAGVVVGHPFDTIKVNIHSRFDISLHINYYLSLHIPNFYEEIFACKFNLFSHYAIGIVTYMYVLKTYVVKSMLMLWQK